MADAHVVVIDGVSEMEGRRAVAPPDHEILERLVREVHPASHDVLDDGLALVTAAKPHHHPRPVAHVALTRPSVIADRQPRFVAKTLNVVACEVAVVGVTRRDQALNGLVVPVAPLRLEHRPDIPVESQPPQRLDDRIDVLIAAQRLISVLHPQHQFAPVSPCEQPVEQRCASAPNMQEPGRRRREPNPRRAHPQSIRTNLQPPAPSGISLLRIHI